MRNKSKDDSLLAVHKPIDDILTPVHKPIERYPIPRQYRFCSYCGGKMIKKGSGIACKNCGRILNILID